MASAGTVEVSFAAETAKFTAELKKVNDKLKGMGSSFSAIGTAAKSFIPLVSVGAVAGFAKNLFNAANELDRLNQKTGIAVESLSRLQFAAEQADTEFSSLTTAVTQFQNRLAKGDANSALDRLGVSVERIRVAQPEDQLIEIARGFESIADPAKRVQVAMELFGKAGADLLPFLSQGADGIRRLNEESDALGATINETTVKTLDIAEKQALRFAAAIKGIGTELLALASLAFIDPEQNAQAEELIRLMDREAELRAEIQRLQNPSFFAKLALNEEERNEAIRIANERLAINLDLIDKIGKKELERLNTRRQSQQFSGADIGEVSVTGQRVRIPGSPENFDELAKDFQEKQNEDINATLLQGEIDLRNDLTKVLEDSVDRDMKVLDQKFTDEQALIDFRHRFELEQEQAKEDNLLRIRQEGFQAAQALMTAFGGKYKKYAQALLVVQKAQAVAQIIVDTQAAAQKAYSTYAATPPIAIAAAGAAIAFGAARIAAVAATFVGSGSAPQLGGSAAAPVFTSNADTAVTDTRATAQSQKTTQVIINGPIYSVTDFQKAITDALRDADDSDVIVFSTNGAQAQAIRAA